jgi:hypothetical protein
MKHASKSLTPLLFRAPTLIDRICRLHRPRTCTEGSQEGSESKHSGIKCLVLGKGTQQIARLGAQTAQPHSDIESHRFCIDISRKYPESALECFQPKHNRLICVADNGCEQHALFSIQRTQVRNGPTLRRLRSPLAVTRSVDLPQGTPPLSLGYPIMRVTLSHDDPGSRHAQQPGRSLGTARRSASRRGHPTNRPSRFRIYPRRTMRTRGETPCSAGK